MLVNADALHIPLKDKSVQCVVTSPPYWSLRDYGEPGQLGLESTPQEYVANMVKVFAEVWRVLKDDGVLWLNLGDTYISAYGTPPPPDTMGGQKDMPKFVPGNRMKHDGLESKDLVGIPWRVAFALQGFALISIDEIAALCKAIDSRDIPALDLFRAGFRLWEELSGMGWYWNRQDVVWHKTNPMPESVLDRCTKSHEMIFLLTKNARYYYDAEAVSEATDDLLTKPRKFRNGDPKSTLRHDDGAMYIPRGTRNRRSVWTITTKPEKAAHFATFPPEIPRICILAGSKPGDVVLDPFVGSGTTVKVARELGREGIGLDLNMGYLKDIGKEKIATTIGMF